MRGQLAQECNSWANEDNELEQHYPVGWDRHLAGHFFLRDRLET